MRDAKYCLAPGLEIVRLEGGRVQLRSDFTSVDISGETAAEMADKVLRALSRPLDLAEIAECLPGYRLESLESQLDALVREGVLVAHRDPPPAAQPPFSAWLDQIGLGAPDAQALLARCKVAIFGLEAHGGYVAQMLADAGVGHLLLADPFPFEPAHHALTPVRDPMAIGQAREAAVARLIARPGLELTTAGHCGVRP